MTVQLNENFALAPVTSTGNKWRVKVIEAGWGSSGYYGADMLAQYGPQVFKAGTKVFMNHPSINEAHDRPERDVHQLAGKLTSDAIFAENGLVADIEFYSHYAPIIKEMASDVGLSIHALGEAKVGEAEGRQGPIIETLVADPLTSVDVVTVAGAGGKFLSLLESYTRKEGVSELTESLSEGNESMMTKEEFEAAIADLKTTLVEAISPLRESISVLVESATPAESEEGADAEEADAADEVEAVDAVEVAVKFNESGLPKLAISRVAESLKAANNTKTVDELIADEKAYLASVVSESAKPVESMDTVGSIQESVKTTNADALDAIVSGISKK